MPYIIKAGEFAIGTTFSTLEKAQGVLDRMGISVGHEIKYVATYQTVGDNGEVIAQFGTHLATATDEFKRFCLEGSCHTYAMTLEDDLGNVLLYWNGGMGSPEFTFVDPMEPENDPEL
jgi:hypothetical protein